MSHAKQDSPHPSRESLVAFSNGQLAPPDSNDVESHLVGCDHCSATLLQICDDDTFLELVREAGDPSGRPTIGMAEYGADTGLESASAALANHPRYELVEPIAKGGMGAVFRAKHRMMDRDVALKVINAALMQRPEAVERFHRETRAAARLSHPNIVTAYDAEQADAVHLLVMEYVDGVNLGDLVEWQGPLPVARACEYARQVAAGLQYAHERGMVHRDIKPHNLMLAKRDEGLGEAGEVVKILDFGLASLNPSGEALAEQSADPAADPSPELTAAGALMGTPDYISPEQATNARRADIRSDLYSLGASLYYLLTGRPPFGEGSVEERLRHHAQSEPTPIEILCRDAPPELAALIRRLMAKDPSDRYQRPQDVADALQAILGKVSSGSRGSDAPQPSLSSAGSCRPPRKRIALGLAAFGALLAGVIFVQTDKGTLRIESVDQSVTVALTRVGGRTGVEVVDTLTGSQVKRLPSGEYEAAIEGDSNGFELSAGGFTLRRGDQVVIRVAKSEKVLAAAEPPAEEPFPPLDLPGNVQWALIRKGQRLSAERVAELQAIIEENPRDVESRLRLLGYHSRRSLMKPESRQPHVALTRWFVEHYPASKAAGSHAAQIYAHASPEGYVDIKRLWLKQVEANAEDVKVLGNAAGYFLLEEKDLAEELLKKAFAVEPTNGGIASRLGHLYALQLPGLKGEARKKKAVQATEFYEAAVATRDNHYWLGSLAKVSFEAGLFDRAKAHAERLLAASADGKAIHTGNQVLGRLALRADDVEAAKQHLLASAEIPGGPSLSSFGPNMTLAKALLELGEKAVVLEYFERCRAFWTNTEKLDAWSATVERGGIPDFGGNLRY